MYEIAIRDPVTTSRFTAAPLTPARGRSRGVMYDNPIVRICALCGAPLVRYNAPHDEDYRRDPRLDFDDDDMCPCGEP